MRTDWNLIELADLGVLRLRGPDGVGFLQGQVSNDVARLTAERAQLAGYHNPQGRVIAVLRLVQLESDDLLAILPRELAATVAARLGKFVLRSKVKISDDSAAWRLEGLVAPDMGSGPHAVVAGDLGARIDDRAKSWAQAQYDEATARATATAEVSSAEAQLGESDSVVELPQASALLLPNDIGMQSRSGNTVVIRVGTAPARWLVLTPADQPTALRGCSAAERDAWRLLDIAAGQPQVYAATSEEFVAQMLNLDALGGIAFDKGCYTGQEVIARAHYRGRVKRRLQRFVTRKPARLVPGDSGTLADGRTFKVVEAAVLGNGCCEFLAVTAFVGAGEADAVAASGAQQSIEAGSASLEAEGLPLPYELPA